MPEPCTCRSNQRPQRLSPMQALHCRSSVYRTCTVLAGAKG